MTTHRLTGPVVDTNRNPDGFNSACFRLRPDQHVVLRLFYEAYMAGRRNILITAPTGWGKSVVLCAVLQLMALIDRGLRSAIWCAHRDRLLMQGLETMCRCAPTMIPAVTFLNTACHLFYKSSILVIDEAHRAAACTYHQIRRKVRPQLVIAATATPFRADAKGLAFDAHISAPSIDDLITKNILAEYEHYALLGQQSAEAICQCFVAMPGMWGKSIMFFATTEEAHHAAAILRKDGFRASPAIGDPFKEMATTAFTEGRLQVLTSCQALVEGIDVPSIQTVFLRDSNRGSTMQTVGRALRRHLDKVANVVQPAGAIVPYHAIARPRRRWAGMPTGPWYELPNIPTWEAIYANQNRKPDPLTDHH